MNSAIEILNYASKHKIDIVVDGEQIKLEAIEGKITDEFLESAKKHKPEILLYTIVSNACVGLDMTPEQFIRVINKEGKDQIISGEISASTLKDYAKQIDRSINAGVVELIMEKII